MKKSFLSSVMLFTAVLLITAALPDESVKAHGPSGDSSAAAELVQTANQVGEARSKALESPFSVMSVLENARVLFSKKALKEV